MGGEIVFLTTRKEFWKYRNNHQYIILKATATWCKPCQRIKVDFMDLFDQMPKNVVLIILDIDKGKDLASFLKIRSVPQMMNFIDGDLQDSVVGANVSEMVNFFNKTLRRVNE